LNTLLDFMHPDPVYIIVCALSVAVVLASAASHKLRAPQRFARQLEAYELLPQALLAPVARLIPLMEAGLALALLVPATRQWAALGAALLIAGYALAIGINVWRGRKDMDCGCSGPGQVQPVRAVLLLRNAALVALALLTALPIEPRALGWMDAAVALLATSVLVLLYTAADLLLANAPPLRALNGK